MWENFPEEKGSLGSEFKDSSLTEGHRPNHQNDLLGGSSSQEREVLFIYFLSVEQKLRNRVLSEIKQVV
jgi:hypothetical protein